MPNRGKLDSWLEKAGALAETCKACGHKLSNKRCDSDNCPSRGEEQ